MWIRPIFTIIPLNSSEFPKIVKFVIIFDAIPREIDDLAVSSRQQLPSQATVTERDHEVVENTRSQVKIKSKLTNLMKITRIEGYNGKYESNPHRIREISDDLFEFDQIRRWIGDRN